MKQKERTASFLVLSNKLNISSVCLLPSFKKFHHQNGSAGSESRDKEANPEFKEMGVEETEMKGDFIRFEGGEDLTCFDILDAPGEVIGKSSYGTLYRANLLSDSVLLLRFLRPACTIEKVQDVMHVVQLLGSVRHPNLVPLCGFYSGPRGEKLLVYPFYRRGNLAQFIRASQEMLEDADIEGYKAPELTKMKNSTTETDIYNLGVILLELITGKEPVNGKANQNQDLYLPTMIRNAIADHRMSNTYHHDVLEDHNGGSSCVNEDMIIKFVQLALACCSPSPSLRPDIKQICRKLEEIGRKS
ncbi:hypothetical protein E3N88_03491 [Mikania micrantha]|uniref:Protein kinase domain-containing protein n=1 Tax=Mikania micrantha TaxID=192012 RepID=A0A5N6Q6Q4_9ASTR|nr:hypothetical protein E3N88_03491 [Mikania micrantha]